MEKHKDHYPLSRFCESQSKDNVTERTITRSNYIICMCGKDGCNSADWNGWKKDSSPTNPKIRQGPNSDDESTTGDSKKSSSRLNYNVVVLVLTVGVCTLFIMF